MSSRLYIFKLEWIRLIIFVKTIAQSDITNQGSTLCFNVCNITPTTNTAIPTKYEYRLATMICSESRSSDVFSLRTKPAKIKNATTIPRISIVTKVSGIVKFPGFRNTTAIIRMTIELNVSINIIVAIYFLL